MKMLSPFPLPPAVFLLENLQKAHDQVSCGKPDPLPLSNNMRCMSQAVLLSVAPKPCKRAPVIADPLD